MSPPVKTFSKIGPREPVTGGIDAGLAKRSRQAWMKPSRLMSRGRLVVNADRFKLSKKPTRMR
jgi:hypothetical protein